MIATQNLTDGYRELTEARILSKVLLTTGSSFFRRRLVDRGDLVGELHGLSRLKGDLHINDIFSVSNTGSPRYPSLYECENDVNQEPIESDVNVKKFNIRH